MPYYPDSNSLYSALNATFSRIASESPDNLGGLETLMDSRIVLRLKCRKPAAVITLNGRERQFNIVYGPSNLRADLTVELASDTLHLILLDELSIKKAWSSGKIKVEGPVWKLKALTDLVEGARNYYPAVFQANRAG